MVAIVQVFGRRDDQSMGVLRGRRPKSAKARNRGGGCLVVPRALWGFGRGTWINEFGLKWLRRWFCR
jgi:hypothetical protein